MLWKFRLACMIVICYKINLCIMTIEGQINIEEDERKICGADEFDNVVI